MRAGRGAKMLENLFDVILQMSFYGTVAGLFAALLCLILRYLPCSRRVGFLLWAVVALRLVCPFTAPVLQSAQDVSENKTVRSDAGMDPVSSASGAGDFGQAAAEKSSRLPQRHNAAPDQPGEERSAGKAACADRAGDSMQEGPKKHPDFLQRLYLDHVAVYLNGGWLRACKPYLAMLWLAGVLVFWGYGIWDAVRIRKRLRFAMKAGEGVYEVDTIRSSCVVGIFRPRIYLTLGLNEEQRRYILCHEQEHIRHHDQIWKPLAYGILGLHWFNILLWMLYETFQNELERYCDEKVIRRLGSEKKEDYCEVLLQMSVRRPRFAFTPLAFGENRGKNDMKDRISQILNYKKQNRAVQALLFAGAFGIGTILLSNGAVLGSQAQELETETETEEPKTVVTQTKKALEAETQEPETVVAQTKKALETETEEPKTVVAQTKKALETETEELETGTGEDEAYETYLYRTLDVSLEELAGELFALRNPYVGDASANGALLDALSPYLPDTAFTQELETQEEPYRLILNLEEGPDEEDEISTYQYENLDEAAAVLLALIDNVDEVIFSYPAETQEEETVQINESYSVQQFAELHDGINIKDYASSQEKVLELLELLDWALYYDEEGNALVGTLIDSSDNTANIYMDDESISVIGGADGPTSVFIAGKWKDSDSETDGAQTDTGTQAQTKAQAETETESLRAD